MNNIKVILTLNLSINLILLLSILLFVQSPLYIFILVVSELSTVIGIMMIFIFGKNIKENERIEQKNKDSI
ncbi:hypothetical protein AT268_31140 [Bacillus cereus]|uniref:Uncharacterized protein n=1 Tax=Bacillus cereus TaxID=1396 RepID=A0A9X0MJT7_BACCE|nr:hypothetical protein [Bacillus cereus]KXY51000.1 hypothetical protein AT268_31140 [Bacillus cereus]